MRPRRQAWLRMQAGKKLALASLDIIRIHCPVESCRPAPVQIPVAMPVRLVAAEHAHMCRTVLLATCVTAIARLPPCLFVTRS